MTAVSPSIKNLPARLAAIRDALQHEYRRQHNHPWVVAYSGGKDSTLLLQLAWEAIVALPEPQRVRDIVIVGNDTLVESPLVISHLQTSLNSIGKFADKENLPFRIEFTRPAIDQTFWVNVIGRGYVPPTRNFRWCTDRMKILPTKRLLVRLATEFGGSTLLVGTRRAESQVRRRRMDRRGTVATRTHAHGTIEGCRVFAPLADLSDEDVWITLMQRNPPWGGTHRNLITLYRSAGGGECPLVLTKDDAPSCGSTSPRFGCWTCTVVKKDRSLHGIIQSGHTESSALQRLFDFREWLIELREDPKNRMSVRRDGNRRVREDGTQVLGPFTLSIRRLILKRLLKLQNSIGVELISASELECIEDVWWRDAAREQARSALFDSFAPSRDDDLAEAA